MKKLIIEIPAEECLEDGDIANILEQAPSCSKSANFPHRPVA